ncbi:hypothetical protein ACLBOM_20745 [Escherichia coli]
MSVVRTVMCSDAIHKERRLQQHTSAQLHAGETVTLQKLVWIDWRDDRQAVLDEWGERVASPA